MNDELFSNLTVISCTLLAVLYVKFWFQGGLESDKTDVSVYHIELTNGTIHYTEKSVANSSSAVKVQQYHLNVPMLPDWWNNGPKLDIKNCVTRNKNSGCSEDAQIQKIFKSWPKRIPESDYLKALKSVKLQTDATKTTVSVSRVFDGTSFKTAINLLARNVVGGVKSHGGDQWISRIIMQTNIGEMVTRKFILIERHQDFNNGSYLLIFPDLQKYLNESIITVEVFLEYSSETIEALRYSGGRLISRGGSANCVGLIFVNFEV